jgi:hypothetical protein
MIPGVLDASKRKSLNKLLSLMQGEGSNLANMLGERKQVAKSVRGVLDTLIYTARDLRRLNFASAVRRMGGDPKTARQLVGKDIANQWLSLQYGWLPLLDDVYGLIEGLHHRELNFPKIFRASSKTIGRSALDPSLYWHKESLSTGVLATGKSLGGLRVDVSVHKYMIRARPDATFAEPAALGFTNPLGVAWEVTPWSFVVDWFLPVSTYLEQLTADHGWYFLDGCATEFVNASQSCGGAVDRNYTSGGWSYVNRQEKKDMGSRYVMINRTTLGAFPLPKLPKFKNPFSAAHVKNGIALLAQVMGHPSAGSVRR